MNKKEKLAMALKKGVKYVSFNKIDFDPANPRGEKPHQIVTDKDFSKLVLSIKKYKILEPLIVKNNDKKKGNYILIDGERRLRAVQKIFEKEGEKIDVPVLIAKDDEMGRILAYQVHMLRKNWNKAAETKAIKRLILDIKKSAPKMTDAQVKKRIKEITAHNDHTISDILKLIKYDDDTIAKVTSGKLDMSYLIQIESNFINKLKRHYIDIIEKYGEESIRQIMISKAKKNLLKNTRYLMDKFKDLFKDKENKENIRDVICRFIEEDELPIEEAYFHYKASCKKEKKKTVDLEKETKSKKKSTTKKKVAKKEKFTADYYKSIKVTKSQQVSLEDIRNKVEKMGGELSSEEYEYIAEGLFCLEKHCFKAAVLMFWATSVSKILSFIDKDISDYNSSSQAMKKNKKDKWRHYSGNFKTDYGDVDEIRLSSNDMQLMCYLRFKKFITPQQFNRLKAVYDWRNDSAHPTDVIISVNEAIVVFENTYNLILRNKNL